MKIGDRIRVQTKTWEDKFGECIYEVTAIEGDNLTLTMQAGTGPWAREGYTIIQSRTEIEKLLGTNKASRVAAKASKAKPVSDAKSPQKPLLRHSAGCMEI